MDNSHPLSAFFPQNVAKNPQNFIGPIIAGTIVQAIEVGILINQSAWFWPRAGREGFWIKFTVVIASVIATVQTSLSFYGTWRLMVYHFGDYISVVELHWSETIQPVLNALVAAPVQGFLIWRCWNASKRRWFVLIGLVVLLLACIISATLITVDIFNLDVAEWLINPPTHLPYAYVLAFVFTVVLDIAITGIMLNYLLRAKANVISRRADYVIRHLLRSVWEAAIPPCVCAVVAMSIYVSMSQKNFWDLFMQNILGKLYLISLFVVLNGRNELRDFQSQGTHVSQSTTPALPTFRSANNPSKQQPQIRVHIQTTVDTDDAAAGDTGDCYELTHKHQTSSGNFDGESSPPLDRHITWQSKAEEGRAAAPSTPAISHTSSAGAVTLVANDADADDSTQTRTLPRTWTENGRYRREADLKRGRTGGGLGSPRSPQSTSFMVSR